MTPLAAHADWSVSPAKRVMSVATPRQGGWQVSTETAGDLASLFARLLARADGAPVAWGVDAPIGLPLALQGDATDFPAFLGALPPTAPLFDVCDDAADISPARPFYPRRPRAGQRRRDLLDGLGLASGEDLLRHCERPDAAPMLWTVGAKQVGKGAICLWRDLLSPQLHGPNPPALWPFEGSLGTLLQPGRVAVAETYPADAMRRLAIPLKGSKRRQADRRAVAAPLAAAMRALHAVPDPALAASVADGFGAGADGEDRFDSLLGLLRVLQVIRDPTLDALPAPDIRRWEGWILGRPLTIG